MATKTHSTPRKVYTIFLLLMVATFFPTASWAAMDMFLDIEGIPGDSVDSVHRDAHDVLGYAFGMSNSATIYSGGGGTGKVQFQDLTVTKWLNKGSPTLRLYCANGHHIPQVILTIRKAGAEPIEFWEIKLTDVIVTSVVSGASTGEDKPSEELTFNYAKVEWSYTETDPKGGSGGSIKTGWDIAANKGI